MAHKKAEFVEEGGELDLVPIMNCVMCLIPVVLAGSAQVTIGVINVNPPKFGAAAPSQAEENDTKPLNLTLAIGNDGFRLTASGADITPDVGVPSDPAAPLIPKKDDHYDYVELYNKLVKVKNSNPNESLLTITAESDIPFKYIASVMDVARSRLEADSYSSLEDLQAAGQKYDTDGVTVITLWPDVVFALAQ